MFWINVKRVFRTGFTNFVRSGLVSFSAVMIMTITLSILMTVIFLTAILNHSLFSLKNSVGVNVVLTKGATQEQIDALKSELEKLPEIESAVFVSADEALNDYVESIKDNPNLIGALNELDENPLDPSINIKAKQIEQYADIEKYISQKYPESDLSSIVVKINYFEKQAVIEKLTSIVKAIKSFGFIVTIIFILLSILITLNTIRLAIYISKDEIKVMNLVGAGHAYITGPFVVTGALYGLISAIVILIAFYPISYFIGPKIANAFFDFDMFGYYVSNFVQLFLILVGAGLVIGSISSMFAIKKYLKN